MNIHRRN